MSDFNNIPITIALFTGFVSAVLGAVPFGLVNLSVIDVTLKHGKRSAVNLAFGATIIEVIYGVAALISGGVIYELFTGSRGFKYLIFFVFLFAGLYFIFRNKLLKGVKPVDSSCFLKGMALNLISFQVFTYWLLAVAFLYSQNLIGTGIVFLILFIAGIVSGKMAVLWLYALTSEKIIAKSRYVSGYINKIMGTVLLIIALYYFIQL